MGTISALVAVSKRATTIIAMVATMKVPVCGIRYFGSRRRSRILNRFFDRLSGRNKKARLTITNWQYTERLCLTSRLRLRHTKPKPLNALLVNFHRAGNGSKRGLHFVNRAG